MNLWICMGGHCRVGYVNLADLLRHFNEAHARRVTA